MKKYNLYLRKKDNRSQLVGLFDSEKAAQDYVIKLHAKGGANIFDFHIEERELEDVINRVKSYADACDVLGVEPMDDEVMKAKGFRPSEIACRKLETIAEALNEGWKPNWLLSKLEFKHYPIFEVIKTNNGTRAELSYANTNATALYASTNIGSRILYRSHKIAEYAGSAFKELYEQILFE